MSLLLPRTKDNKLFIAGMDEAGRGSLYGAVYAAICVLPIDFMEKAKQEKIVIRDSKKMTKLQRMKSREFIEKHALDYNVQSMNEKEIDEKGILKCTMLCMNRCVDHLKEIPFKLCVDGNYYENHRRDIFYETLVKGDDICPEISCASILAKTYRDDDIIQRTIRDPSLQEMYHLDKNMGYGTKQHMEGLQKYGLTEQHRRSFCKKFL